LQGIRQGTLRVINPDPEQTAIAHRYHAQKHRFFPALAAKVPGPIDAVLSPPSSLPNQAEPYLKAIKAKHAGAVDLTSRFTRTGNARAGQGASVCDVAKGLNYLPAGDERNIRRLVIVDDTFNTGTTAAAVVKVLRQQGLAEDCEVIVASPLWLAK
jgi:glutamine phosphoribosylpyrophosphate amidotransferase